MLKYEVFMKLLCCSHSSDQEDEEEALLKKLYELSITKPVKFNLGDAAELKATTTTMCSSSVSEEDSGFVSSETAPVKEMVKYQYKGRF